MIALRAVQGSPAACLIPMAFTLIITLLPKPSSRSGSHCSRCRDFRARDRPTIGGYLTRIGAWQYIFYVNLVPGALMVGMLYSRSTPSR